MASRSSARFAALFVVLAGVIALFTWLALGLGHEGEKPDSAAMSLAAGADGSSTSPRADAALLESKPAGGDAASARATAPLERDRLDALRGPTEAELAEAWWVSGRITFPDNTPGDERAFVVGVGKEFGSRKLHRVPVAADGTFKVAFHKSAKKGTLRLEARYVFFEDNPAVKPADADKPLSLVAHLGGALAGRIVPSAAAQPFASQLSGGTVVARGWKSNGNVMRAVSGTVSPTLEFELGGLDPDTSWRLAYEPKGFAPIDADEFPIVRGKRSPMDVPVLRGASVNGTVRDAAGAPVEGANIQSDAISWSRMGMPTIIATDKDGKYTMEGLRTGKVRLSVIKPGYAPARPDVLELADGEVRSGFDVVLGRGNSVSGVVRWKDGTAAAGVRVEVEEPPSKDQDRFRGLPEEFPNSKSTSDGTFTITGLGPGPYTVTARSGLKEVEAVEAKSDKKPRKVRHQAQAEAVEANTAGLALVLDSGSTVRGRVVDDRGAPVDAFEVRASYVQAEGARWNFRNDKSISRDLSDAKGEFELIGLADGEWSVHVRKDGTQSNSENVVLPGAEKTYQFTLPRQAKLRGVVLDPAGAPVADARIEVDVEGQPRYWRGMEQDKTRKTDAQGTFDTAVSAGALEVRATHTAWAGSDTVKLSVAAAQEAGPVTLTLRRGGTITGEVRDKSGQLAGGRTVSTWVEGPGEWKQATTDASGTFVLERVTPGKVHVDLQPTQAEMEASRSANGSYSWSSTYAFNGQVEITLAEGATEHVVLGGAPASPVRVFGVVRSGKPLEGAEISMYRQDADQPRGSWRTGRTDSSGKYEITLDAPGEYQVSVGYGTGGGSTTLRRTIPAGSSYELNIDVPAGRIAGKVVSESGAPLANVRVIAQSTRQVKPEDGEGESGWGNVTTAADGTFVFDLLPASTYTISAGSERWNRASAKSKSHGTAVVKDIELAAGGSVTDVVLRLPRAGSVRGVVTGPDGPVAGVEVRVKGGEQESAWFGSTDTTDASGRYQIDGLNPGTVVVSASTETSTSRPSAPVAIRSGESAQADLRLEPGAKLRLVVEDAEGKPTHSSWKVLDEGGNDCSGYKTEWSQDADAGTGWVIGPLPAGTYTVKVTYAEDKKVEQEVRLSGTTEKTVRTRPPE